MSRSAGGSSLRPRSSPGNPLVVPLAQVGLGRLLVSTGKPERGRQLLEAALESRHSPAVPDAQVILGGPLVDAGEPERARQLLEAALSPASPGRTPGPGWSGQAAGEYR